MSQIRIWNPVKDAQLKEMYVAGVHTGVIAEKLMVSEGAVIDRRRKLGIPKRPKPKRQTGPKNPPKTKRDCLKCQKGFMSEGNHERICKPCKSLASWGSEPFVDSVSFGRTGR